MLGLGVVYGDDRVLKLVFGGHGGKPNNAGGGFLGAADDIGQQVRPLGVEQGQQVGAVVHGHLGLGVQGRFQVSVIGLVVFPLDGVGRDSVLFHQCCGNIVLGAQWVAGAEGDFGASVPQSDSQVGRFAGHVQAGG